MSSSRRADGGFAVREIELQRTEHQLGARDAVRTAHECATAREQLRDLEGLGEIVIRAEVERVHAIRQAVARGEHQHGNVASAPAQIAHELRPSSRGRPMSTMARSNVSACNAAFARSAVST